MIKAEFDKRASSVSIGELVKTESLKGIADSMRCQTSNDDGILNRSFDTIDHL